MLKSSLTLRRHCNSGPCTAMQSLKTLKDKITERITTETALSSIFLWVFVNNFSLCRDGSSCVEPVLSNDYCVLLKDTTQWRRRGQKFECSRYSIAAHSTKIKMRGSRGRWQRVLTPTLEHRKPLGLFSNTGPDPLENQKLPKPAFHIG